MAPTLKLIYFELPGRAEPTRLMLAHAGVQFEDSIVTRDTWPSIKPTTPFGQVPVLEVDGKPLAESGAIERYVGSIAGLVPSDPWAFAKAEEAIAYTQDIADAIRPTYSIADLEEKIKARQALLAGALGAKLERLQALLEANGGEYFACNQLSYADFIIYCAISMFISGFLDGFPKNLLDKYPGLKAHHNRIAALPAVAAKYENITEGLRVAYKTLP